MDTIIPAQHSKVVKIPKHGKELKDQPTRSNKSTTREKSKSKHNRERNDSDSDDDESTVSEESEKADTTSDTETDNSEGDVKPSKSKKVQQKQRRIRRTHNPNVEFIEQPTEKDLKSVLMKEIDEEIDLNRRLSRNRKRSSKKSKQTSLKESFTSKLKHVRESFHKKIVWIPTLIIIILCILGGIIYYINKKHPGFFTRIRETITRKKHLEKTEKIFN